MESFKAILAIHCATRVGRSVGEDVQAYVWYMDQHLISALLELSGSKADNYAQS
jgi:hypothetical protein